MKTYFPKILDTIQVTADEGFDLGQSVTDLLSWFQISKQE